MDLPPFPPASMEVLDIGVLVEILLLVKGRWMALGLSFRRYPSPPPGMTPHAMAKFRQSRMKEMMEEDT